jgi:predicted metalloprotease
MRWRRGGKTPDVIDQRGGGGGLGLPGGRMGIPSGLGLVGIIVFLVLQFLVGGGGFGPAGFDTGVQAPGQPQGIPAGEDPQADLKDFSAYVFTDAQDTWKATFKRDGQPYENAKLVLYSGGVNTGCGSASSAVGPFYCPADQRVYLDLSFYDQMANELNASGDFAWAYVIAHEMGHHVQRQIGTSTDVQEESRSNPDEANKLSVRLELQADCYSGVWANTVFKQGDLEKGDVQEATRTAAAIGDDRLQERSGRGIDPDSFTHGTSAQRTKWFETGYESGDPGTCDTFSPDEL